MAAYPHRVKPHMFNRLDAWPKHFSFMKQWRMQSSTACGRATVAALGMNRLAIFAIRMELALFGRFSVAELDES